LETKYEEADMKINEQKNKQIDSRNCFRFCLITLQFIKSFLIHVVLVFNGPPEEFASPCRIRFIYDYPRGARNFPANTQTHLSAGFKAIL
jgi:hypothetical protein